MWLRLRVTELARCKEKKQIPKGNERKKGNGRCKIYGEGTNRLRENDVGEWVRLCGVAEAPGTNEVMEVEARGGDARGVPICLANVEGKLSALGNICPHRQGPLGEGWVEDGAVMCPWHAWAFDVETGEAAAPEKGRVEVYRLRVEGGDVLVELK